MSGRASLPLSLALALMTVLLVLPTGASTQDSGHGHKWWKDTSFRRQLGLTDEQATRIDTIYQSAVPHLEEQYDTSRAEEKQLQKLMDANEAEDAVSQQIDKAEEARCAFNKTRVLMLYRMRMVLSPEQRAKFRKLHDDWEHARHKSGGGHVHDQG